MRASNCYCRVCAQAAHSEHINIFKYTCKRRIRIILLPFYNFILTVWLQLSFTRTCRKPGGSSGQWKTGTPFIGKQFLDIDFVFFVFSVVIEVSWRVEWFLSQFDFIWSFSFARRLMLFSWMYYSASLFLPFSKPPLIENWETIFSRFLYLRQSLCVAAHGANGMLTLPREKASSSRLTLSERWWIAVPGKQNMTPLTNKEVFVSSAAETGGKRH